MASRKASPPSTVTLGTGLQHANFRRAQTLRPKQQVLLHSREGAFNILCVMGPIGTLVRLMVSLFRKKKKFLIAKNTVDYKEINYIKIKLLGY